MKNLIYILLLIPISIFAQDSHTAQRTYEYDNLNRLVKVVFTNGETYEYTYDNLGNRTQINVTTEVEQTYVPDDNFEQALIDLGYDSGSLDDYVPTNNINDIEVLYVSDLAIEDLTGIEDFSSLKNFECLNNNLTTINISQNVNLERLYCSYNQITDLDVSQNLNLKYLYCFSNELTNIDISQNQNLEELDCGMNLLTNIDVVSNTNLKELSCSYNQISNINVSQNSNLERLSCSYNNILVIDVTQNSNLEVLQCINTQITSLDVSQNSSLNFFKCSSNSNLHELNVKNGNNSNLILFKAQNNPNLTCIQVDNVSYADNQNTCGFDSWCKDDTAEYSEDCGQSNSTIELPFDNYTVNTVGLTCINSQNGILHITANAEYTYNVEINSPSNNFYDNFDLSSNNNWDLYLDYLEGGEYTITITIANISEDIYKKIFILNIDEPEPLEAARMANGTTQTVTMRGTAPFFIYLNEILIAETNDTEFTFEAKNGDVLEIETSKSCEGKYTEILNISEAITIYPNPTDNEIHFILNSYSEDDIIEIQLVDANGKLIKTFKPTISNSRVSISLQQLPIGIYYATIVNNTHQTFKIIKK